MKKFDTFTKGIQFLIQDLVNDEVKAIKEVDKKAKRFLTSLGRLKTLNYYVSKDIRVPIKMKEFIAQTNPKVTMDKFGNYKVEFQKGSYEVGSYKISTEEILNIVEFGSNSHDYPPSGLQRRILFEVEKDLSNAIDRSLRKKELVQVTGK